MCHWRRWIAPGLLAVAILSALALWLNAARIEAELAAGADRRLAAAGLDWARVEMDGRDARVTGVAPLEGLEDDAVGVAAGGGVRTVVVDTALLDNRQPLHARGRPRRHHAAPGGPCARHAVPRRHPRRRTRRPAGGKHRGRRPHARPWRARRLGRCGSLRAGAGRAPRERPLHADGRVARAERRGRRRRALRGRDGRPGLASRGPDVGRGRRHSPPSRRPTASRRHGTARPCAWRAMSPIRPSARGWRSRCGPSFRGRASSTNCAWPAARRRTSPGGRTTRSRGWRRWGAAACGSSAMRWRSRARRSPPRPSTTRRATWRRCPMASRCASTPSWPPRSAPTPLPPNGTARGRPCPATPPTPPRATPSWRGRARFCRVSRSAGGC